MTTSPDQAEQADESLAFALVRLQMAVDRGEYEQPRLASPDGTVAVQITDLRAAVDHIAARHRGLRESTTPVPPASQAETFASIIQWGDETFGSATHERIIDRAWEEWEEMLEPGADVPVEAADVIIVLLRIPGIADAIERKMAVNRTREWRLMGDGTGYHVPPAKLEPIIVDGKRVAVQVGSLRIYSEAGKNLIVSGSSPP